MNKKPLTEARQHGKSLQRAVHKVELAVYNWLPQVSWRLIGAGESENYERKEVQKK